MTLYGFTVIYWPRTFVSTDYLHKCRLAPSKARQKLVTVKRVISPYPVFILNADAGAFSPNMKVNISPLIEQLIIKAISIRLTSLICVHPLRKL